MKPVIRIVAWIAWAGAGAEGGAEDLEAEEMMPPVDLARTQSIGGATGLVDLVSNLSIVSH